MARTTKSYNEIIAACGFRFTEQRRRVYDALMLAQDHPTAVEVFMRVKPKAPTISLATVYNCLETLTECGLVRHVNLDRAPSRYCANRDEHAHFFCDGCGAVMDVPLKRMRPGSWDVPPNTVITHHEVALRGLCSACAVNGEKKRI